MAIEHVLIVEDEALLLDLVTAEFEDAGFTVLQAMTAEDALVLLRCDAAIDLMFTDIRLPGAMDGWQLAEAARQIRPTLAIIYATSFSADAPRPSTGSMFFTKPYRPSAILAAMRSFGPKPTGEEPSLHKV